MVQGPRLAWIPILWLLVLSWMEQSIQISKYWGLILGIRNHQLESTFRGQGKIGCILLKIQDKFSQRSPNPVRFLRQTKGKRSEICVTWVRTDSRVVKHSVVWTTPTVKFIWMMGTFIQMMDSQKRNQLPILFHTRKWALFLVVKLIN